MEHLDLVWLAAIAVAGTFVAVLVAGYALSELTLRSTRRARAEGATALPSRALGRAYAFVLAVTVLLFYLVTPVVVVGTVVGGLAFAWQALSEGHFHGRGMLFIGAIVLVSAYAGFSGIWTLLRIGGGEPGAPFDLDRAPKLRRLLDEVAERVGTRPIDKVFLTPTSHVGVFEHRGARCLVLGIGILEGFSLRGFRAVLAHEYGHFANGDTAGGTRALAVRRTLEEMLASMRDPDVAGRRSTELLEVANPTWLFLSGFRAVFLRVSQGASRLQEYLADQWAAKSYGPEAFEEGFRHLVGKGLESELVFDAVLEESVRLRHGIDNLYRHRPASVAALDLEPLITAQLERTPGPYDSHPRPVDRFEWVRAVADEHGVTSPRRDADDAWTLFEDRESIEVLVTEQVRQHYAKLGLEIPTEAQAPRAAAPKAVEKRWDGGEEEGPATPSAALGPDEGRCPSPGAIAAVWREAG